MLKAIPARQVLAVEKLDPFALRGEGNGLDQPPFF
jgi:hypothetical protein